MTFLLLLPLLAAPARSAEVTALPPKLRGSASLAWQTEGDRATLEEQGFEVGARSIRRHDLQLSADFAAWRGVVLGVKLPVVLDQRIAWTSPREMTFDPSSGGGSYIGADRLGDVQTQSGGGLAGPSFHLTLAPLIADQPGRRVSTSTMLFEVGYRLQDRSSFWQAKADGSRGGGEGADALLLRGAFSKQAASSEPYLEAKVERSFTVPTTLRDANGEAVQPEAAVRPASRVDLRAGVELPVQKAQDHALHLDLRARFGYRTWQDIPSGLYLPDVLAASREVLITQGDSVYGMVGLGLGLDFNRMVDARAGVDVGTETPYRVEHPYPVRTKPGAVIWQGGISVRVWLDDPLLGLDPPQETSAGPG